MRLASYNVENLFDRPAVMDQGDWGKGKEILEAYAKLNGLLGEFTYTPAIKQKMVKLLIQLGLKDSDQNRFVILRRNRGKLLKRSTEEGPDQLQRADWAGQLELVDAAVDEEAMRNTARVINEVNADVLAVVEAESRPVLSQFNEQDVRLPNLMNCGRRQKERKASLVSHGRSLSAILKVLLHSTSAVKRDEGHPCDAGF